MEDIIYIERLPKESGDDVFLYTYQNYRNKIRIEHDESHVIATQTDHVAVDSEIKFKREIDDKVRKYLEDRYKSHEIV